VREGFDDEPVHPILSALSVTVGGFFGLVFGFFGFLLATVFPAMLRTALPGMPDAVFLVMWGACVLLVASAFGRVFRNGKGLSTRVWASCGVFMIVLLFAGELTGTISVYPWHTRFLHDARPIRAAVARALTPARLGSRRACFEDASARYIRCRRNPMS